VAELRCAEIDAFAVRRDGQAVICLVAGFGNGLDAVRRESLPHEAPTATVTWAQIAIVTRRRIAPVFTAVIP
jgi:hypothetical protein